MEVLEGFQKAVELVQEKKAEGELNGVTIGI